MNPVQSVCMLTGRGAVADTDMAITAMPFMSSDYKKVDEIRSSEHCFDTSSPVSEGLRVQTN